MSRRFYFAAGSQDLYGDECLEHVAEHARKITEAFNSSSLIPYEIVYKPTLLTSDGIEKFFREANSDLYARMLWLQTRFAENSGERQKTLDLSEKLLGAIKDKSSIMFLV